MSKTTVIKERPILFSAPMVNAIRAGRKTQTRRVVKFGALKRGVRAFRRETIEAASLPEDVAMIAEFIRDAYTCPYGVPGDRLWVKERFSPFKGCGEVCSIADATYVVLSDGTQVRKDGTVTPGLPTYQPGAFWFKWRPSIHMPRWASRILLEVVSVRVERVQSITPSDAMAEGITMPTMRLNDLRLAEAALWAGGFDAGHCQLARVLYRDLWNDINGDGSWATNPWVWVVEFRRIT